MDEYYFSTGHRPGTLPDADIMCRVRLSISCRSYPYKDRQIAQVDITHKVETRGDGADSDLAARFNEGILAGVAWPLHLLTQRGET